MRLDMVSINAVIAVVGATVIFLSVAGLSEIHSRAGPFEEPLVPAAARVTYTGSYTASPARGTLGPSGICVPATGDTGCAPPRHRIDLAIAGLPRLPGEAIYQAFLLGPETLIVGVLNVVGTEHRLQYDEAQDGRAYHTLLITLERETISSPGVFEALRVDVAGKGQSAPSPLSGEATATFGHGEGSVRAAEIGAFAKSATAIGELTGLPNAPGWTYHAWFVSTDGSYIPLGVWEIDAEDPTRAALDGRVERVRLEDQARFLTTLESGTEAADSPQGPPAFVLDFAAAQTMG